MNDRAYVAFDLGAGSGRGFLGTLREGRLDLRELCRFPNGMVGLRGHLFWDVPRLLEEVLKGLEACASERMTPTSVAVDTWGVDFALLGRDGLLLGLPRAYRDPGIAGAMEQFFDLVSPERVYEATGIQLIPINTLYQLYGMARDGSPLLEMTSDLLMMSDLFTYLLTGQKKTEFTIATTSQLYNPRTGTWEEELFAALGLRIGVMQEIVPPGTAVGELDPDLQRQTGLGPVPVMATASHDTAAAVASVPAEGDDWAYISSGTWSLMGVESAEPIITPESLDGNFTNEGGVGGAYRVLKNISGLWALEECRRSWAKDHLYSYEELTDMAAAAVGFPSLIEPDHRDFLSPQDMPEAIRGFCGRTGQQAPETPGEFVRCVLVSLALKYRMVLEQLRRVYRHPITRVHIIGGGVRNELLSQLAADAMGIPVIAGPVEATAIGNVLVQAMGMGDVQSPTEVRQIVRQSFRVKTYEPGGEEDWDLAYERFRQLHDEVMTR